MAELDDLTEVERRVADLLARRHTPGRGPGGWRCLADVRPSELQRIIVDDVQTLSGAGLLAPVESPSLLGAARRLVEALNDWPHSLSLEVNRALMTLHRAVLPLGSEAAADLPAAVYLFRHLPTNGWVAEYADQPAHRALGESQAQALRRLADVVSGVARPPESAPVRVSRLLSPGHGSGVAQFDRVTVELPGPPTREHWDLARQLAEGLARGETRLVFPPGAVVTYDAEPPTLRPAAAGGFAAPEFLDPPFAPEELESESGTTLGSVTHPAPIPDPTTVCVTVFTADGGTLVVERMPVADADALVEAFRGPTTLTNQVLTVTLDDCAVTHLARRQITRIDLDFDPSPPTAAEPPDPSSFSDLR